MSPVTIGILVYLFVGIVVLGAFEMVDWWFDELAKYPCVAIFCQGILALTFWPILALAFLFD